MSSSGWDDPTSAVLQTQVDSLTQQLQNVRATRNFVLQWAWTTGSSLGLIPDGVTQDTIDLPAARSIMNAITATLGDQRHLITFGPDGWFVRHPFTEALDGSGLTCPFNWTGADPGVRGRFLLSSPGVIGPAT